MLVHLLFTALVSDTLTKGTGSLGGGTYSSEPTRGKPQWFTFNNHIMTNMNPEGTVEPQMAPFSQAPEKLADLEAAVGLPPDAKLNLTTEEDGIHSDNVTNSSGREELRWEGSLDESNLTSVTKHNGTAEPHRAPFSQASEKLADLEAAVGLPPDAKLNLTTEEDESFQDQEQRHPLRRCHKELLEQHIHSLCGLEFEQSMEAIGAQHWCSFDQVIRPYNSLTVCLEQLCSMLDCYYPNPTVQDYFLHTHAAFFLRCPEEKVALPDAPHALVVVLTLGPVTLIPLLVYLVVRNSNGRD